MEKFTITKLWELRAELDKAIAAGEYEKIKLVKDNYQKLVESEKRFCRAFMCYNFGFWTESERASHNLGNIVAIYKNIEDFEHRYIEGADVSLKLKTRFNAGFLAGEIWVLRAMYDSFVHQTKQNEEGCDSQQNMILGRAIIERLVTLVQMEQVEDYYGELLAILKEVRESYNSAYGRKNPKIDYYELSKEYVER